MTGIHSTGAFVLSFIAGLHQKFVKRFPSYPPVVGILCVILCAALLITSVSVPFGELSTMVVVTATFLVIHSLQIPFLKQQDSKWTPRLVWSGSFVCILLPVMVCLSTRFPWATSVSEIVVSVHMIIVKNTAGTRYSLRGIGDDRLVWLSWTVLALTCLQCGLIIALAVLQHFNNTLRRPETVWIVPSFSPFMFSITLLLLYLKLRTGKTTPLILAVTNLVVYLASVAVFAWGYRNRWSFRNMFIVQLTCAVFNQLFGQILQLFQMIRAVPDDDDFPVALRFNDSQVALGTDSNGALRPSSNPASSASADVTNTNPP